MSPTPEASKRQRKAASKAWETIHARKAETAKAKETASQILEAADAIETSFGLERDLQRALRTNIEQLESGLTINDGGKEKVSASGRTDILALDAEKKNVVIELKVGTADREVIAQILSYMGDLQAETGDPVRGIVIAHEFTARAIAASKPVSSIELRMYRFNFTFTKV
jgi:RecB family endonuclease NucS